MSIESEHEKKCFASEPPEDKNNVSQLNFFTAPYPIMSDEERERRYKIATSTPRPKAQIFKFNHHQNQFKSNNLSNQSI